MVKNWLVEENYRYGCINYYDLPYAVQLNSSGFLSAAEAVVIVMTVVVVGVGTNSKPPPSVIESL